MTDQRPPPASTMQVAGQAATDVIGGLKAQPLLLGIVVLNIIGIAAALYFLDKIATQSDKRWQTMLEHCLPKKAQS